MASADIPSPALVVSLDKLERNITAMAERARQHGIELRPHAKTHKTLEVARLQVGAGAVGLTVATLGEAESFADGGFDDLFIAYPLWVDRDKARRLAELATRVARLRVGVDSGEGAEALGRAMGKKGLEVLVEVDSGHHRSGVTPEAAGKVAGAAARAGLTIVGVFTFPGHSYSKGAAAPAAKDEADALEKATLSLERAGHAVSVRSGGSTPTARHAAAGVVTELRPGVYVFNDAHQIELGTCTLAEVALMARSTVVSTPAGPERIVLDAGSKTIGADRMPWMASHGLIAEFPDLRITSLSEHHAVAMLPPGHPRPTIGEILHVVPNHVCTAVNLVDELWMVDGGELVGRWAVRARGLNS